MTRNNDTSYRQKGRAVFLAAIMVLSVVGASVAFTGSAAAVQPSEVEQDELPGVVYPGEVFNVNVDQNGNWGETGYLVNIERDDTGQVDGFSLVSTIEANDNPPAGDRQYQIDTSSTESGNEYALANTSSFRGTGTNVTAEFVAGNEEFDAEWDSDGVDDADSTSFVELESDRSTNNYNISVQADGLSYDQLVDLFNATDGPGPANSNAVIEDERYLPLNGSFGPDISDGDDFEDLEGEDVLTLDLSALRATDRLDDGELNIYPSQLAEGEGFPDDGEYEFDFRVTDTDSSATDSLEMNERNVDANFNTGSSSTPAGDIASFNISMSDTDETWVQIGGSDSGFVDILYIERDDAEPVEVDMNTRLMGTDANASAVYSTSNAENFGSVVHPDGSDVDPRVQALPANRPNSADDYEGLYGIDGDFESENDYFDELVGELPGDQIIRPLQATDYQIVAATSVGVDDGGIFDADADGAANNQLDSKTLTLNQPTIGDITVHTAPEEAADDTTEVSELVDAATPTEEVALDDRLVVQVEATGIYGAMVANMTDGDVRSQSGDRDDWARYDDGVASTQVLYNLTQSGAEEGVDFSVEAESATGNQGANTIDLQDSSDSEAYVVLDADNGQFFLIADTSDEDAFSGSAPEESTSFTASLDYVADNSDERYEFDTNEPFDATDASEDNFPYLLQGEENSLSASASFDMAPRQITFDNVNEDGDIQVQATEDATISGSTNVAPGSDAELRLRSTSAAESFQFGNDVNITEDGSVSTTYDLSTTSVDDEFNANFRISGAQVDSASGVIVESVGDDTTTNETDDGGMNETDDGDMDDGETEPADDGETNETTDDGESTDDGTPGFGAVVALIVLIGAALLAVRRQN